MSVDRRRFFREMMVQAIEGAEELGKQMQQGRRFPMPYGHGAGFDEDPTRPPGFPHLDHGEDTVQGPPWPPAAGPPIPLALRRELREPRAGTVSRSEGPGTVTEDDAAWASDDAAGEEAGAGAAPASEGDGTAAVAEREGERP